MAYQIIPKDGQSRELEGRLAELQQKYAVQTQLLELQQALPEEEKEPVYTRDELCKKLRDCEYLLECETELNNAGQCGIVPERFSEACKDLLLCDLQQLQGIKLKLLRAECAHLVLKIHEIDIDGHAETVTCLLDQIDEQMAGMDESQLGPVCAKFINDVRGVPECQT